MLKIKDSVDLKELEKFGFEITDEGLNSEYYVYVKYIKPYVSIRVDVENRRIYKDNDEFEILLKEEEIYDLIKADMVEKVEG